MYEGVQKSSGKHVAIKVVSMDNTVNDPNFTESMIVSVKKEVALMLKVSHLCCLTVIDYFEDIPNRKRYIVLELARGGDLFEFIRAKGRLKSEDASMVFCQICCAVKYLHSIKVIHRDLKPENVLLCNDTGSGQIVVKISDFGLAKSLDVDRVTSTLCGTAEYVAPEVIATANRSISGYTEACDYWSLGAILYFMYQLNRILNKKRTLIKYNECGKCDNGCCCFYIVFLGLQHLALVMTNFINIYWMDVWNTLVLCGRILILLARTS